MPDEHHPAAQAKREYTQLLRLHEQLLAEFARARDELLSPSTESLVKQIKGRTGSAPDLTEIKTAVEESIRALKLSQSHIQSAVTDELDTSLEIEGVANMPAYLQRFLAERAQEPGFTYEVVQDPVRGWIVAWKEYTNRGTVRGYGQICERPYAWAPVADRVQSVFAVEHADVLLLRVRDATHDPDEVHVVRLGRLV
jgi:hypothetical protein